MKKWISFSILSMLTFFMFSAGLIAQEQTEVSIQVKKDGTVIQDTIYRFDDADEARHAVMMMEVLSGHGEGKENISYNYTSTHPGSSHSKAMVFISEDGETTKIEEFHGDSLVWVSKDDVEGDMVKEKQIRVVVSDKEDGSWNVIETDEEVLLNQENVFIKKGDDDLKVEMKKIMKEYDGVEGANVKVIVITSDEVAEYDKDLDQDVEVEVKVIKKKEKVDKK